LCSLWSTRVAVIIKLSVFEGEKLSLTVKRNDVKWNSKSSKGDGDCNLGFIPDQKDELEVREKLL